VVGKFQELLPYPILIDMGLIVILMGVCGSVVFI